MTCMSITSDRLQLMVTFIQIVDSGSIMPPRDSCAWRIVSEPPAVSARGVTHVSLITRTTHQLSLTDAGRLFLADCQRMVRGLERDRRTLSSGRRAAARTTQGRGVHRARAADSRGDCGALLPQICRSHTGVECRRRPGVDTRIGGFIVCSKVGPITERSVLSRTVGEVRGVLVASRILVDEREMPHRPGDLKDWPMISVHPFFGDSIPIRNTSGTMGKAKGVPRFFTSNIVAARGAARAGAGFTLLPEWLAAPEIRAGTLIHLLPDWAPKAQPLSIGTPPTKHRQLSLVLFVNEIVAGVREHQILVNRRA